MRRAVFLVVLLSFAVSAGWAAAASAPTGSLSIEDGRGTVVLKGKGIVIGRLGRGEVQIVDLSPLDQWSPRVNGVPRGKTVWLRGKDVNFYVPGGRYRITVRGDGFSVSARGQGAATLTGRPDATGATGTYAVGDDVPAPLPGAPVVVDFGLPLVTGAPVVTKGSPS
jgi:hypothetical protein